MTEINLFRHIVKEEMRVERRKNYYNILFLTSQHYVIAAMDHEI